MEISQINAVQRTGRGKGAARKLRASGQVPAVVYGLKKDPVSVAINPVELTNLIRHSPWRKNTIFSLVLEGGENRPVLLQDIVVHPVSREMVHVDLLNVDFDQKLRADVPLKLVGRPEGVKAGGLLQQMVRTVKVECLPKDLPFEVQADISHLNRKESMMIEEVPAPEGTAIIIRESVAVAVIS